MDVRAFLKANNLKQRDLARFLDVTEAAISNVVKGKASFSDENLIKILNNPYGWDTSMLTESDQPEDSMAEQPEPDTSLVEYLKRKVAELEGKVEKLTDEKADLLQQNAVLKYENQLLAPQKGRNAEDAESSLSVSAAQ